MGPPKRPTGASAVHPSFPGTSTSNLKNQNGLRNTILPHSSPCWLPPHAYFMIPAYSLRILHPARHPSAVWSISAWQMFPRRHVLELQDLLEVLPFLAGSLTGSVPSSSTETTPSVLLGLSPRPRIEMGRAQADQRKFC